METAELQRREAFSPKSLSMISLYGPDWISAYYLLNAIPQGISRPISETIIKEQPVLQKKDEPFERPEKEQAEGGDSELIQPPYTDDYFRHQGLKVEDAGTPAQADPVPEDPKTLMVVMSFAEWLSHFKIKNEREEEETRDKRALRSMWQQEKLAAALEDEPEEIPEDVFEMAVSSITREDDLASESLAEILEKQGKWIAASEMYRKLGLRNPAKSGYFASRAEAAKKRAS